MRQDHRLQLGLALTIYLVACGPSSGQAGAGAALDEGYVESVDGVELYYRLVGEGSDTVVVLHGGPGFTMHSLFEDLRPLAESHVLLFYDQRGTGSSTLVSDSASLTVARFTDDLEAIRNEFGFEQLTLLGHSWGAAVAALYAHSYAERIGRLVVVNGTPLARSRLTEAFQLRDARRDTSNVRLLAETQEARLRDPSDASACRAYYKEYFAPFYADGDAVERSRGDFCAGSPEALRNKVESVDAFVGASLGQWDWRPAVSAVSAPSLVIHGTADVLSVEGAREWATTLEEGRLLLLEGVGHFPYVEAPDVFFPAVETFLAGRWPEPAAEVQQP